MCRVSSVELVGNVKKVSYVASICRNVDHK